MPLPDISRLTALDDGHWRALGLRLGEIGLNGESVGRAAEIGEGLPAAWRAPLGRWHLVRIEGPAACAMRLLVFDDPISLPEACQALGEPLLGRLLEAGLVIRREDGRIASPFYLSIADGLYIFCDDLAQGGEAVMGAGETTANLCRAAYSGQPSGRVLDLGCGAGTVGLVLARHAESVVGTDINPRALSLARLNAAINGIGNIEFRQGDCFDPVAGESFDLIASQPPFVARPEAARNATYLYGGPRGDELPMRIVAGVCAHLAPQGRAVLLVEWPELDEPEAPLAERIATALTATDARSLHLCFPASAPDYHCGMYAAAEAPDPGAAYTSLAWMWRDHFEAQGIRRLRTVCTAIQRDARVPAWSAAMDVPAESAGAISGAAIGRWIANRDLASRGREALLEATLRVPRGAVFAKEYTLDDRQKPKYVVRLPEDSLAGPVELSEDSLLLVSLLHEEPTVRRAVEKFATRQRMEFEEAADQSLPAIERLLLAGVMGCTEP